MRRIVRSFSLPLEIYEELASYSHQQGKSINSVVVEIIEQFLKTNGIMERKKGEVEAEETEEINPPQDNNLPPAIEMPEVTEKVQKEAEGGIKEDDMKMDQKTKYIIAMKLWDAESLIDLYRKAGGDEDLKGAVLELLKRKLDDPHLDFFEKSRIERFMREIREEFAPSTHP